MARIKVTKEKEDLLVAINAAYMEKYKDNFKKAWFGAEEYIIKHGSKSPTALRQILKRLKANATK